MATAMRVSWYGTLTFGLVSVPVGLYVAREEQKTSFRMIHKGCGERINLKRSCPKHGELSADDIGKAYEYAKNEFVEVDENKLDELAPDAGKSISIDCFVKEGTIDPILYGRAYYLVPDKEHPQREGYALLVAAMKKTGTTAIATFSHWGKDNLCSIRVYDNTLMMHLLHYAEDIRDPEPVSSMMAPIATKPAEVSMAVQLVKHLAADFDHTSYQPEHRERIRAYVSALASGKQPTAKKPAAKKMADSSMLDALKASVAENATPKKPAARKPRVKA